MRGSGPHRSSFTVTGEYLVCYLSLCIFSDVVTEKAKWQKLFCEVPEMVSDTHQCAFGSPLVYFLEL